MAKEFKEWDKRFTKHDIEVTRKTWLFNGSSEIERNMYKAWPHDIQYWSQSQVRSAVYELSSSPEWQLFRVAMKGLSTPEKLYMLMNRFDTLDAKDNAVEKCRIDNYIGALVRGGQLNANLEMVR